MRMRRMLTVPEHGKWDLVCPNDAIYYPKQDALQANLLCVAAEQAIMIPKPMDFGIF